MDENTYPRLFQMFAGYMHQDWVHDYIWEEDEELDFKVTVDAYKEDSQRKPQNISTAIDELEDLISKHYTNALLKNHVFPELCIAIDPEAFGYTHQQFLIEVLKILKE